MRIETSSASILPGNPGEASPASQEPGKEPAARVARSFGDGTPPNTHIRELSVQHVRESVAFLGDTLAGARASPTYDASADPRRDGDSHVRPLSWQHVRESLDCLWATLTGRERPKS